MPITRSQQGSAPPSESGQEASLSPGEIEILNRRISEKEKMLQEQADALKRKQDELEQMRYDILQAQSSIETEPDLRGRIEQLERLTNILTLLPEQFSKNDTLHRRVTDMQPISGRDTPEHRCQERTQEQSPIRLKDAVDSIPKYDGHKISVFQFCKICERALNLIPKGQEYHLVQLIINKLSGHAYAAVEGVEYPRLYYLTKRLKEVFGPNKSTDQYRGELANIYMKPNEHILDYVERVKELRTLILDGESTTSGHIDEERRTLIEMRAKDSFINGLPPELLVRVKLETPFSLEQAVVTAIQLTKTLEAENSRKRAASYKPTPNFRADVIRNTGNSGPPRNIEEPRTNVSRSAPFIKPLIPGQPGPSYLDNPERICFYCKAPGHFMKDCPKIAFKTRNVEGNFEKSKQGNAPSISVTGVRRDAAQGGRPSASVMVLQEATQPPTSPN